MNKILPITNAIIAIVTGLIVLSGYFFPANFRGIQSILLEWAIILAGFGLLLGVFNLARVHLKKIISKEPGRIYSFILLVSLILTIILAGINGPTGHLSLWIFNTFQVPIETSLLAILAVILVYAMVRLFIRQPRWNTILFIITVIFVLLGSAPLLFIGDVAPLRDIQGWLSMVLAIAGVRGLLLGVALGTVATGIRILIGVDRPYGG